MVRSAVSKGAGAAIALSAVIGVIPSNSAAETFAETPVRCGAPYTVQIGDTLFGIANRRVTPPISVEAIMRANPDRLADPSQISVGLQIAIPCASGVTPAIATEAAELSPAIAPQPEDPAADNVNADAAVTPDNVPDEPADLVAEGTLTEPLRIDILTGGSLAPFIDRPLADGGNATRVVDDVMALIGERRVHVIDVVDDWTAHLHVLLQRGKYDLAYPYAQPNCADYADLSDDAQWRCDNLRFSAPIEEVTIAFYARAEEAQTLHQPIRIWGKRLCRPAGHFMHDLVERDLSPPFVNRVEAASSADCFERLIAGEVDVVSVEARVGAAIVTDLDATDHVAEIEPLASTETLHVVGLRANARVTPLLEDFDRGLAELRGDRALAGVVPVPRP
ncbi:MAG: LysM peptidoglycan-binding domain-containing protein [Pseudomonadota bacterium]